jgi:hypothetical protein
MNAEEIIYSLQQLTLGCSINDMMRGTSTTHGRDEKFTQGFGWKALQYEITRKK